MNLQFQPLRYRKRYEREKGVKLMRGEEVMGSRELFWIIRKYWKLLLLLPLVCAGISAYMSDYFITPMYQASAKVLIKKGEALKQIEIVTKGKTTKKDEIINSQGETKNEDIERTDDTVRKEEQIQHGFMPEDANFGQLIAPTYTEIAKTREVMSAVKEQLNTAENGDVQIQLTHIKDTQLLNLKVVGTNPEQVFKACDVFMQTFSGAIEKVSGAANLEVVEAPQMPQGPMGTNKKKVVLGGFFLGLLLAAGSALIIENVRDTIKTEEDIHNKTEIALFGAVPCYASGRKKTIEQPVSIKQPNSFATETFKGIRTVINALSSQGNTKTLLFTGVKEVQGTSTVASNLACVLANEGKRVLLVDCNLRKPSLHKIFEVENNEGLMEMLEQGKNYKDYVVKIAQGLDLLPLGSDFDREADVWGTEAMKKAVKEINDNYDYVLLDTPSVTLYSDALALSSYSDAVLLVVKQDSVSFKLFEKGVYKLRQVSANLAGTILNGVKNRNMAKKY